MKVKTLSVLLIMFVAILQGCSEQTTDASESGFQPSDDTSTITPTSSESETTLYIESELSLEGSTGIYRFLGFIGDDTLVFGKGMEGSPIFHPAKEGHTFNFRYLGRAIFKDTTVTAEILEFSRDEGYVKLKITTEENKNGADE